ncbi:site-specific integrase [uncultured Sunxiuqinia sp.]|uniref:site-specific integrase n=1 Tax=uncultured Sunxiuqinia sp. TaxID=1573825 RepID=UPI002AA96233|nr:site-specific integrase [uncultured Sunxiuqinia sp.]
MASVKLKFKTDKTLSDGTHPIVIQVIHNRKRKIFFIGHSATKKQWDEEKNCPNSKHPDRSLIKSRIKNATLRIKSIILDLENKHKPFSVDDIEKKYKNKLSSEMLGDYTDEIINNLKRAGKEGNSKAYQYTLNAFNKFSRGRKVRLADVNHNTVLKFEQFLKERDIKTNTISFYLRTLRAIINRAVKDEIIEESAYPFKNISIKSEKTRKRAVNKDIIKLVEELDVSKEDNLQLWKDLFMFSFYNRGMNVVDMAFLQVKNIEAGRLKYTRRKTGQHFSIKLTEKSKAIITRYNNLKDPESYIFPIIYRKGKEYLDYKNAMRLMNKKLKKISELLKLDVPLTTYVSRHSWATIAKKSGISTAIISEGLGHESEETTQVYLDSFENDVLDDANDVIIG